MPTPNLKLPIITLDDQARLDTLLNSLAAALDVSVPEYITTSIANRFAYSVRTKNTNQTVATATWALVPFQATDGESGITYSNGTFTVTRAGVYMLSGSLSYVNGNTTGQRTGAIYKNGSQLVQLPQLAPHTVGSNIVPISAGLVFAAGDTFAIYAYHSSGGNLTLEASKTNFSVAKVG